MTNQYFATPKKLFSGDETLNANPTFSNDLGHGDFNCDGNIDLVFTSLNFMFISFGNENGDFTEPQVFEDKLYQKMPLGNGGSYSRSKQITVLDINKDGKLDLVVYGDTGAGTGSKFSNVFTFLNIFECPTTSSTTATGTSFTPTDTSTSSITATVTNTSTVPTDTTSSSSSTIDATTMFKLVESTDTTTTDTATTKTQTTITDTSTTETMFTTTATTTNGVAEEENRKSGISFDSETKANIALGFSIGSFLLLLGGFAYVNHKINNMKHCTTLTKDIAVVNPSYNNGADTNTAQQQSFYEQPVPMAPYSDMNGQETYGNNAKYEEMDTNV